MYGIELAEQTKILMLSMGLGLLIGILYDIFRIIRLSFNFGKIIIAIQDIIFFLILAGVTFAFALTVNKGQVRGYIIFGEIMGFLIYYFSFGIFVIRVSDIIIVRLKRLGKFIYKVIAAPIKYFIKKICYIYGKFSKKMKKTSKKGVNKLKFLLQRNRSMLYNVSGKLYSKAKKKREGKNEKKRQEIK